MFGGFFKRLRKRAADSILAGAGDAARELGLADDEDSDGEAAAMIREYLRRHRAVTLPSAEAEPSANGDGEEPAVSGGSESRRRRR